MCKSLTIWKYPKQDSSVKHVTFYKELFYRRIYSAYFIYSNLYLVYST